MEFPEGWGGSYGYFLELHIDLCWKKIKWSNIYMYTRYML